MDALKAKVAPKEKQITVKVRNVSLGDHSVVCSNLCTIEQVKEAFISLLGAAKVQEKSVTVAKLRFFSLGKELKDDLFLYSYEVGDNIVV